MSILFVTLRTLLRYIQLNQILDKFENLSTVCKLCCSRKNNLMYCELPDLQNELNKSTEDSKKKYYPYFSVKLVYPSSSSKTFWSLLKTSINHKKIPGIPPRCQENKFVIDLKKNLNF